MSTPDFMLYAMTAILLYIIGLYGIAVRRNMVRTIVSLEIITASVNLNFLAFTILDKNLLPLAQYFVAISIVLGAAVASLALMIVIQAYRHYGSVDLKKLSKLRW
ncbi:MAG: NADH-quinone oxidoreductase subunit K [archaeon]|nr:NADH-quinone oxidoreductase subunit K [archaeon]MCP8320359.1 NADH-quinone oxidoreductase subunit K [archaeon]